MAEGFKGKVLESGGDAGFSSGPSCITRVPVGTRPEGLVRDSWVPVEAEVGLHGGWRRGHKPENAGACGR